MTCRDTNCYKERWIIKCLEKDMSRNDNSDSKVIFEIKFTMFLW